LAGSNAPNKGYKLSKPKDKTEVTDNQPAALDVMIIDGKWFVEVPTMANWRELTNNACSGCVLDSRQCSIAVSCVAEMAFGGDCDAHDVIYVETSELEHHQHPLDLLEALCDRPVTSCKILIEKCVRLTHNTKVDGYDGGE